MECSSLFGFVKCSASVEGKCMDVVVVVSSAMVDVAKDNLVVL